MSHTPVMFAADGGHIVAVRALLVSGADPDIGLADGRTVSDFAKDHPQVLAELNRRAQHADLSRTTPQAGELLSREP